MTSKNEAEPALQFDSIAADLTHQGFAVIDGVIDRPRRDSLLDSLVGVFNKYSSQKMIRNGLDWDSATLHQSLIDFRRMQPKYFGAIYDMMQNCLVLQQIFTDRKVLDIVTRLLNESTEGLTTSGLMLRMDPPTDTRNSLGWHQEASYYTQNRAGNNGVVVWTPLFDVELIHGPVEFCSGSHQVGLINVALTGKSSAQESAQFEIPLEVVNKFKFVTQPVGAGSVVVFNMHTIHRSGSNSSGQIRFAAGARFHKILTRDFLPGRVEYVPSNGVGRLDG